MSERYNDYIYEHKTNVLLGYRWLERNLPELFEELDDVEKMQLTTNIEQHDKSKYELDEYDAYDAYFYGGNKSYEVVEKFNRAWLLHLHRNPHHWQYWILRNDDPKEGTIILDMPYIYIIEMICDWWAFSWAKGNLNEIFKWYEEHRLYMQMSPYTREKVVDILLKINNKIDECDRNEKN